MSESVEREKLYAIMMEESRELAKAARRGDDFHAEQGSPTYWLERAAENLRRYAEWSRVPPPATKAYLDWLNSPSGRAEPHNQHVEDFKAEWPE